MNKAILLLVIQVLCCTKKYAHCEFVENGFTTSKQEGMVTVFNNLIKENNPHFSNTTNYDNSIQGIRIKNEKPEMTQRTYLGLSQQKPGLPLQNSIPIRQNPRPIQQNFEPIRQIPRPIGQNSGTIQQNSGTIGQNSEPNQQNPGQIGHSFEPIQKNPGPFGQNFEPIQNNPGPVSQNPEFPQQIPGVALQTQSPNTSKQLTAANSNNHNFEHESVSTSVFFPINNSPNNKSINNDRKKEIYSSMNNGQHYNQNHGHGSVTTSTSNGHPSRDDHLKNHGRSDSAIENNKDLCTLCLCNLNTTRRVLCQHEHQEEENLHKFVLNPSRIPKKANYLKLEGYEEVEIANNTFSQIDLNLTEIIFENIKKVIVFKDSFYINSQTSGTLEVNITFKKCNFDRIASGVFTQHEQGIRDKKKVKPLRDTRYINLNFIGCTIRILQTNAISEARLEFFKVIDSEIGEVEPMSIDVDVGDAFELQNTKLPILVQNAIRLNVKNSASFFKNIMTRLDNRSIVVESPKIIFEENMINHINPEALMGLKPPDGNKAADISFIENKFFFAEPSSLKISENFLGNRRRIHDNMINIPCECNVTVHFERYLDIKNNSKFAKLIKENILSSLCKIKPGKYKRINDYLVDSCGPLPIIIISLASAFSFIFVIMIIIIIICCHRAQKAEDEANNLGAEVCSTHSFAQFPTNQRPHFTMREFESQQSYGNDTLPNSPQRETFASNSTQSSWVVAMPDVKMYKETEVLFEHIKPIYSSTRESFMDFETKHE